MSHDHAGPADSAGAPWAGRRLAEQPWAGDDGQADPRLAAAVARCAQQPADAEAWRELSGLLLGARLLVPVVARAVDEPGSDDAPREDARGGGSGDAGRHSHGDRGAQMSVPLLASPGGGTCLPAFTGVATLAAWDRAARPVPALAAVVASSALAEGCAEVLLDPGLAPVRLAAPLLVRLAAGLAWSPAWEDAEVAAALADAQANCPPGVRGLQPLAADDLLGLGVGVDLPGGWTGERVSAVTQQVGALLAADPRVAERVLSLRLVVRATA